MKILVLFALFVLMIPAVAFGQDPTLDPAAYLDALLRATQGRQWIVVVGFALTGLTALLRKGLGAKLPWFKTDRGGAALAIITAVFGAVGASLATGGFSAWTLIDAVALAVTNAGGYVLIRKLLKPSDKPALVPVKPE